MKRMFYYICLILLFWYANNPYLLERKFFVNEFLSVVGFFIFLRHPIIYKKNDYIYNSVITTIFIFSAYALASLAIFHNFYGYLRHTVLVYSIFSFFLGTKMYQVLATVKKNDFLFLSAIFPFHRVSYHPLIPLFLSRYTDSFNTLSLIMISASMIGAIVLIGGTTGLVVVLLIWSLYFLNQTNRLIGISFIIAGCVAFGVYMYPYLDILSNSDVSAVMENSFLLQLDGNATVRFLIWAYLFFDIFLDNIFGIGLGTPMISNDVIRALEMDRLLTHDPLLAYTLGAHNSFLTILIRFGVFGIIPFFILYWRMIREYIRDKIVLKNSRVFYFYYSFFIVTGCALLNVVLESPIHASLYWGSLGILYQAKRVIRCEDTIHPEQ